MTASAATKRQALLALRGTGGSRLALGLHSWQKGGKFGDLQRALAQGVQHHQGEGEAIPTTVDAVNQYSVAQDHAIGFKSACKVLVGHLLGLSQFFDERFRPSLVYFTWLQFERSYLVFDARILRPFTSNKGRCIKFNACIKNIQSCAYTAGQLRPFLAFRESS